MNRDPKEEADRKERTENREKQVHRYGRSSTCMERLLDGRCKERLMTDVIMLSVSHNIIVSA